MRRAKGREDGEEENFLSEAGMMSRCFHDHSSQGSTEETLRRWIYAAWIVAAVNLRMAVQARPALCDISTVPPTGNRSFHQRWLRRRVWRMTGVAEEGRTGLQQAFSRGAVRIVAV